MRIIHPARDIFTKQEKIVLIFLLVSLFVGAGLIYYKKVGTSAGTSAGTGAFMRIIHTKAPVPARDTKAPVPININKASKVELIKLKHIGPVLADRIISYRKEHGPFENPEDIKKIKGIGQRTYENLKKQIILE